MSEFELPGWDRLRHSGVLFDAQRLKTIAGYIPDSLSEYRENELRQHVAGDPDEKFVSFILERLCSFTGANGVWYKGRNVTSDWARQTITGGVIKPSYLWKGDGGGILPVFTDEFKSKRSVIDRRRASEVSQWLRAGKTQSQRLAILTNGDKWRLVFAGLDFDAWCEWDRTLWFEEGGASPQLISFRTLISPALWELPSKDANPVLLQTILDTRKGQAELSTVLGERVREAVEILVSSHGEALKARCHDVDNADIYRAAVRVIMRMVVAMFAESRDLLPRYNAIYHGSYGLSGLIEELEKVQSRGGGRLKRSISAWPRMLALFRLIYLGSHHPDLPVPAYGGDLFKYGDDNSTDGLMRALAVFESACFEDQHDTVSDDDVYKILEKITRTKVKVRQGRSGTWVKAPVDFSDMSSEYIGILYEGLLDFELKTALAGDPVVFLALGNQPALPLSVLEGMDNDAIADLLKTLKQKPNNDDADDESDEESPGEENNDEENSIDEEVEIESVDVEDESDHDERGRVRTRAEAWARSAVKAGGLATRPSGRLTPEREAAFENEVSRKAKQLVNKHILPGEWYLVRWGGTRKGSGSFYTRPGLAVPTVRRTLQPLAYSPPHDNEGKPNIDAPSVDWSPKLPEEVLSIKVCDPACGSGTFPVTALRYLTDALFTSLYHHHRITPDGERSILNLLGETSLNGDILGKELLPYREGHELFEPALKAVLRRHVVERCIYGVDIDPLAIELCRLSLWIETMDRDLPFSFLDHKIKCGNGLVGAWFDTFQHYPVMAWKNREGGDKNHSNGVHFDKEERTKEIKAFVNDVLKSDLRTFLAGKTLFSEDMQSMAADVHKEALATMLQLHEMSIHDNEGRAKVYREKLIGSPTYQSLKRAMDLWCACWFWPIEKLESAPLPTTFANPLDTTLEALKQVVSQKRFFHWEIEFPDVFNSEGGGFDAILGNPPWDVAKPVSKEFFSNIDPLYRSYGKQEAIRHQTRYFGDETIENSWLSYTADFRAQANYLSHVKLPFGDPLATDDSSERFTVWGNKYNSTKNLLVHDNWREARSSQMGYADSRHPFRHQGSADINLYKTFVEMAHSLLRSSGRLGFIVPSGIYSDHGTGDLRKLFLDHCNWEWLFGFENRKKIFDIHRSYKFNPIIIQKGGSTEAIKTSFMRRELDDWERAEDLATLYSREQVVRFSPRSKAILEIQSQRDLEILEKIYSNSVLLGDDGPDGWGVKYAREFDMTNDSKLFPPRPKWEAQGYQPDDYSRWLKGEWRPVAELWAELGVEPLQNGERRCAQPPYDTLPVPRADVPAGIILLRGGTEWIRENEIEDVALPLYQGVMIWQMDFSVASYVSGAGNRAKWNPCTWESKRITPQFLMQQGIYTSAENVHRGLKLLIRDVTNATNQRTMIAALTYDMPAGHKTPTLITADDQNQMTFSVALSSFCFDYALRVRFSGTSIIFSVLAEQPLISLITANQILRSIAVSLNFTDRIFSTEIIKQIKKYSSPLKIQMSLTESERLRQRIISDIIIAKIYNLENSDLLWILRDCALPIANINNQQLNPKGFWRVDKDKDPELRQTVLTLVAFHDLEKKIEEWGGDRDKGIEAFLNQNDGEGWMIPETLRLADYGLGHDDRAKEHQPVASRLGPRFYDWQLAQSAEESWRECHLHARNMLGEEGYKQLLLEIETGDKKKPEDTPSDLEEQPELFEVKNQMKLF